MSAQFNQINPSLYGMIKRGQLNSFKLSELIRLKEIVERFVIKPHISNDEVQSIKEKFGTEPDVITWGDYFQAEIGSQYFNVSDEEFSRIVDTVRFDLISAAMIFTEKPDSFFDGVLQKGDEAYAIPEEEWTEENEEAAHLMILRNYFLELELHENRVSDIDRRWFNEFVNNANVAVG